MKKNAVNALAFCVLWVLYCLAVLATVPESRNPTAWGGLVLGSLFMWLTGFLLLAATRRARLPVPALAAISAALLAADLGAKALVDRYLSGGAAIALVPGWLGLRFAPNYSNNVILDLLGIVVESGWFHAAAKLVAFVAVGALLFVFCRREGPGLTGDGRFRLAVALLVAGAASSIAESAFRGYVLDFISFAGLVSFDIKDLCLMYGVGLLVTAMAGWEQKTRQDDKEKRRSA